MAAIPSLLTSHLPSIPNAMRGREECCDTHTEHLMAGIRAWAEMSSDDRLIQEGPSTMASFPVLEQETLFQNSTWSYRIPALLYLPRFSIILAFAEEREDVVDEHAKLLSMRRGVYDPTTHHVQWNSMETIVSAQLKDHRSMNPCPVYDEISGKLILFFIAVPGKISEQHQLRTKINLVRLCYVTSMDQGRTWSTAQDVTNSTISTEYKNWATFAVGPGHGLQLLNKARSLVIPAYAYRILDPKQHPTPHAFCFISSDHGTTWEMGNFVGEESAVECQVAEVHTCGRRVLYCNARSSRGARIQAVSYNHGVDFEGGQRVEMLVEPPSGCHGSVTAFPPPPDAGCQDSWLLYAHPTDPKGRRDLGIYLNKSPLNPARWTKPSILFKGLCAYSDLQYMGVGPDGSPLFSCLFEYGTHQQCEEIIFVMFTLKQAFPSER
ncbi:sialidase-2 isoform X1 [Falco biarmicus]|uniref:sialidase-2 isoform X1 n=1 Tax=Falco cherrug TaxID=345164 RepID=UPI000FFC2CB1|nr:sialidase-2 isoform X1 [Falco cherrug]XP_056213895.1 sialidase-2 isoform X1 [Falco biarmicus]